MHRYSIAALLLLCSCTCGGAPAAGGATPYVRCAAADPAVVDRSVGTLHVRSEGRVLTIDGASAPLRLAVFRGAALTDEPIAPALDAIEAGHPTAVVLLGSIGDESRATALVTALSELPVPILVVLGGRDHQADLRSAIAEIPETAAGVVIDVSPFRSIRAAGIELIPVAGAPDGRYSRDDDACGLGEADVDSIVSDVGEAAGPRFLIGFAAPSPSSGIEGEAGSDRVRDLAARVSAPSGMFAWPDVPTPRPTVPTPVVLVAPALVGPSTVLSDGSRMPAGPLLVELSEAGLRVAEAP